MKKRIKIGVGGRYHADRLAKALLDQGWEVSLVTSFPASRFSDFPRERIESFLTPEIIHRLLYRTRFSAAGAIHKMKSFGRSFSNACLKDKHLDIVLGWSSFALEAFESNLSCFKVLVRDSTHIIEQTSILSEEYKRLGVSFPDHSEVIRRELKEYELADKILVLSEVAKQSFIQHGVSLEKLEVVHLGADLSLFEALEVPSVPAPILKVVYFGALSIRKGVHYLIKAMEDLEETATLDCIGSIEPEMKSHIKKRPNIRVFPPMPHETLASKLREYEVFVLPSLEDGFGMVVPQAMASGLIPIVSSAAGACEFIKNGVNGFIVPPRDSKAITQVLKQLMMNKTLQNQIRANLLERSPELSWQNYSVKVNQLLSSYLS